MAKETYKQLDEEKKNRIMEAIIDEFSEFPFSQASINRIIKQANISRGSFYQYFNDKEDCYLELLNVIANEKMILFKDVVQLDESASLFDHYMHMMKQVKIWMEKQPKYYKIGFLMERDNDEFIKKLNEQNPSLMNYFIHLIKKDIERGIIKSNVDPQLLSDALIAINSNIIIDYFHKKDYEGMIQKSEAILELIKYGTLVHTGEDHV